MIDRCLAAYKSVLMSLPEQQRDAFALLMNAHGLHPDDPSIAGVTLNFMVNQQQREQNNALAGEAMSAMAEFKRMQRAPRVQHLIGLMMSFQAGVREATVAASMMALSAIGLAGIAALTVHNYDVAALHDRVCSAETKYTSILMRDATESAKYDTSRWIGQHSSQGC